ncbi:AraC family transcriptional regulator [Acinetobacter sp. 1124_18A]|uniref:AraC family transcriptional regulator n=1 Tax=Acinetobacter sp. 1124_18A TaxID=2605958 RepID=UPI00405A0D62
MEMNLSSEDLPIDSAVLVSLIKHILDNATMFQTSREDLLSASGIDEESLVDPNACIPLYYLERIVTYCYHINHDPLIGLKLLQRLDPAAYGVLGHLVPLSGTLGDAIEMMQRYQQLIGRIGKISLKKESGLIYWGWACRSLNPIFIRCATEYNLGYWSMLVRLVRDNGYPNLLAVHFNHEIANNNLDLLRIYEQTFQCPVYFGQPESALILSEKALSMPLRTMNAVLYDTVEQLARKLIKQMTIKTTLAEQVRSRIRLMLHQGKVSRKIIASQLGMNERTLSRNLQLESNSYSQILDEVRFELAKIHLHNKENTVESIAKSLGFNTSNSFINWFRALTSSTPGQYQKNLSPQNE